jgi:ubiquinone/menaquinone biosynthesis C-methylase UbiE
MSYYDKVGTYYDKDAVDFEQRYHENPALQRIRQSFRQHTKSYEQTTVLEVGFGPGFDLVHFAEQFPDRKFYGIDISAEMVRLTQEKIDRMGLKNAWVTKGSVEDIKVLFPEVQFDMIYVFFGALNTVNDLEGAFTDMRVVLSSGGRMVLTFVNKYYIAGTLIELLKLKPKFAFARWKKVWGGYSPTNFLASRCYRPGQIKKLAQLECTYARGYSIFYPAWYYHKFHKFIPKSVLHLLWQLDERIALTPMGKLGEYMLYTFEKKY